MNAGTVLPLVIVFGIAIGMAIERAQRYWDDER